MEFYPFKHYGAFLHYAEHMAIRINIQKQFVEKAKKAVDDCKGNNLLIWEDAYCKEQQEATLLESLEESFHAFLEALDDSARESLLKRLNQFPETRKAV